MRCAAPVLALAAAGVALSGCVAAAVPVAAGGVIAKRKMDARGGKRERRTAREAAGGKVTLLPPGSVLPPPGGAPAEGAAAPAGIQYLYGSGEAAAASMQAWRALIGYVAAKALKRPADSVVLVTGASLAAPAWMPCGAKPLAAVFDVDETVLLNLGFEYDAAGGAPFDPARWAAWERTGAAKVTAVPGAKAAIEALRTMGVTVIFNTNRSAANAAGTEAAIDMAGLGTAKHGETLFLAGDVGGGTGKDARRMAIAQRYCVIAMGGDQLGDFSDLFNAGQPPAPRRAETLSSPVARLWGAGWFMLPNPAYGPALKGARDEIFAPGARWSPTP